AWVFQRRLDDGEDIKGVRRRIAIEELERGQRQRRERLVEREVQLQVDGEPYGAALLVWLRKPFDHAAGEQGPVDRDGTADVPALSRRLLVVVGEQVPHGRERVTRPGDDVEQHRVADREAGAQRLRLGRDQALEGWPAPADRPGRRLLADHLAALPLVVTRLGERPFVLDDVV